MENDEDFEQQLYNYRYLTQQRDRSLQELEFLRMTLQNLHTTKFTIENMKSIKEDEEILVPLGGMLRFEAKIKNPEKVFLHVSQDVVVEKDLDSTIEFLNTQINKQTELINQTQNMIQNLSANIQAYSNELQKRMPQQ